MPKTSFIDAIRQAFIDAMIADESVVLIGEGVPDPKAIFGSTAGLQARLGEERVFDMPLSENALTGICLGAAVNGIKPVLMHQRIDFSLLSMDQMVNHAAKWHAMFNAQQSVPMVIRTIIGKGWGQGPQHSQALWGMLAQVPGIKIALPATAKQAYLMMRSAIEDPNPVLFVEHRWLHHTESEGTPEEWAKTVLPQKLAGAEIVREGKDITLAGWGYSLVELLNAAQALEKVGISAEVVDLRVGHTLDIETLTSSILKTHKLLIHDLHPEQMAPAHSVISKVVQTLADNSEVLKDMQFQVVAQPNHPVPTSWHLAKFAYSEAEQIVITVLEMYQIDDLGVLEKAKAQISYPPRPDIPNQAFKGPF